MYVSENLEELFYSKLATKPYCSFDKKADRIRSKASAIKYPYIQPNPPHLCAWLVFDCDHSDIWRFETVGIAVPNFIVMDKETLRHHIFYAIKDVYTTEKARKKPLDWLAAIERTFAFYLQADTQYVGLIAKNPAHSSWKTWCIHDHVYDLAELADYKDLLPKPRECDISGFGRNCELFDNLRHWSYRNIHKHSTQSFPDAVLSKAEQLNVFAPPLPFGEVKSIAKSVTKYCERNRAYFEKRYGRKIGLNPELDLQTKQSLGAMHTANVKADATRAKIQASVDSLLAQGNKATQKAVAELSKVSLRTVKTYWKEIRK
ncbi:TPA: replication initiation protein [Vibrio parahaemolyticus]|nr:replication initiation protein [Vibrio parahaemolyticus]